MSAAVTISGIGGHVKSRMVINSFHKNLRAFFLPLFECLNRRDVAEGSLRDVVIIDVTRVEQRLAQILR